MSKPPAPSLKILTAFVSGLGATAVVRAVAVYDKALSRVDRYTLKQRRVIAVAISLFLHLGILLLILPSQKGFLSIGTTGLGDINGAGTAVTLVDASELTSPQAAQEQVEAPTEDQAKPVAPPSDAEVPDVEAPAETTKTTEPAKEQDATTEQQPVSSDSQVPSNSTTQASAGAFGQNGETYTDLWNAIAPCWNRIADVKTLPAKLTISFSPDGGLSAPPVIERDPDAEITDESLHAEAKALQALSECGAYPMAKSLQSVTVKFPPPWQLPQTAAKSPKDSMANRH